MPQSGNDQPQRKISLKWLFEPIKKKTHRKAVNQVSSASSMLWKLKIATLVKSILQKMSFSIKKEKLDSKANKSAGLSESLEKKVIPPVVISIPSTPACLPEAEDLPDFESLAFSEPPSLLEQAGIVDDLDKLLPPCRKPYKVPPLHLSFSLRERGKVEGVPKAPQNTACRPFQILSTPQSLKLWEDAEEFTDLALELADGKLESETRLSPSGR